MRWFELEKLKARAVILAEGKLGELTGKTTNILVMYSGWRRVTVKAVIDSRHAGKDAGEILNIGKLGVPVVSSIEEALSKMRDVDTLIVGIAPVGGRLPEQYRAVIRKALEEGLNVWSGLHYFLSEDPEFRQLAEKYGRTIVDFRKPPRDLRIWSGDVLKISTPKILVAGTDCSVGKNVTSIELTRALEQAGLKVGLVGTGQTMLMVGADCGTVIDAVPADFVPGEVERHVVDMAQLGKDVIVVEGQAALLHPAYAQVTLGIYYGVMPHGVVLCHDPWRTTRESFDHIPLPSLEHEIRAIKAILPHVDVIAIAVMGYGKSGIEIEDACSRIEKFVGVPAVEPRREPNKLRDLVLDFLKKKRLL